MERNFRVVAADGSTRYLTPEELDRIRDRIMNGEHHRSVAAEYGMSQGWAWSVCDSFGLEYSRKTQKWTVKPDPDIRRQQHVEDDQSFYEQTESQRHSLEPAASIPLSEKEQRWQDRINKLIEAIETLDAKLESARAAYDEVLAVSAEDRRAYAALTAEYETLKADNDRLAREVVALHQRVQALTMDHEQESAAEDAYDRAGTLLDRVKKAWSF